MTERAWLRLNGRSGQRRALDCRCLRAAGEPPDERHRLRWRDQLSERHDATGPDEDAHVLRIHAGSASDLVS
jgi:hypothetical protein